MKFFILFFVLSFLANHELVYCLKNNNLELNKDTVPKHAKQELINVRINLGGIGIGIETKVLKRATIYLESGSGFYGRFGAGNTKTELTPYFQIQPRFFTNLYQREKRDKVVRNFSAAYISPNLLFLLGGSNKSLVIGGNAGIQLMWTKRIYYGGDFGAGLRFYEKGSLTDLYPILHLKAGFVF